MGKKRKSKDPFDDVLDVVKFGAKTSIAVGALTSILGATKK